MAPVAPLNKEQKRHLLLTMLESRHGDLREESLNRQGKGHFHVSGRGHEALAAIGAQLREGDFILPYYRDRGLCSGRGLTLRHLALEYFAKRDSASRGRMMPSHFSSRELNIVSVPTPLGAQLLPACGIAWGLQLDGTDGVVVTTIGDAATRQGDFFEAISFAAERRLPILFIVEDNGYGISTPTRKTNPLVLGVLDRAQWVGLDGADTIAVHAAGQAALAKLRAGEGPVLLWTKMVRLASHTSSDDHTLYRSKEDIAAMEAADPVRVLKDRMLAAGEITVAEFAQMEATAKELVRREYAAAEQAENPHAAELLADITGPAPHLTEELFQPGKYRMGDLINRTLRAGLAAESKRMIFGQDVEDPKGGVFRLTQKLSTDFPAQVFNSPLAESTIIGVAGGLALYGRRPVFELQFIDFIYPGFNQLVSNLANLRWRSHSAWKTPIVLYAPYGAYLPGGGLWHSQANEAVFAHFPGINIVIPSTPEDAAGLLWTAMQGEDITLFLAPKHMLWAEKETVETVVPIPLGLARRCLEGNDLTLVAWGNTMEKAYEAIAAFKGEVNIDLIDLRSIAPWDRATIEASVRKTGRLIVVQEDGEACSVGQMIITHILGQPDLWAALKAPPLLVAKPNVMIGYNPIYEYAALPDAQRIIAAIEQTVGLDLTRGQALAVPAAAAHQLTVPPAAQTHGPQNTVIAGTNDIIVRVPIMGEGLRSARVVSLAKQPGDVVQHDDVLCEVETDKAVYPIEASFAGRFKGWQIKLDDTVLIGQAIAIVTGDTASIAALPVEGEAAAPAVASPRAPASPLVARSPVVAPVVKQTPVVTSVISTPPPSMTGNLRPPDLNPAITKRLQSVVATNMLMDVRWDGLRRAREVAKQKEGAAAPSPSVMMAWGLTRAQEKHAAFRCLVDKEGAIHESIDFDVGVAVALPGDRLATASIARANLLSWADFKVAYQRALEETRSGKLIEVQAPLNITSLGAFGIESATPIVVPPSMATVFIGAAHERLINDEGVIHPAEVITLSLTFDHRVVNGAGAAAFMQEVKSQLENFQLPR